MLPTQLLADVVKPALIEINVESTGDLNIEIRASIEALLTGINGKYKNTKDAPNADEYDTLREKQPEALKPSFDAFADQFLQYIVLTDQNGKRIPLSIISVDIPERGYTKVPRISVINLTSHIGLSTQSLQWYYPLVIMPYVCTKSTNPSNNGISPNGSGFVKISLGACPRT